MEAIALRHEQAFIGSCILGVDKHGLVDLSPEDFSDGFCRSVWNFMRGKKHIDMSELAHTFDEASLSELVSQTATATSMAREAKHIKGLAHRRRMAIAFEKAQQLSIEGAPLDDISHYVMAAMDSAPVAKEAQALTDIMADAYHDLESAHHGDSAVNFVPTDMPAFDRAIGGIQQDGLIIVAGRPSMGKTAFATGVARKAGVRGPVLMASMEMSGKLMAMRYMAAEQNVDLQEMMQGKLTPDAWRKLAASVADLSKANIWVNDTSSRTVTDIAAEARRFKRKHGKVEMIVVDYLTLLKLPGADRVNAIGDTTRAFKVLAGEIGCPIVLLAQLNRKLEERKDKTPMMSDLRDSGAIEQDADQILFPYRPEVYEQKPENEGLAEIHVAKNRNGKTGVVKMAWVAQSAAFKELQQEEI